MDILNDFDTSVRRALSEIDPEYEKLRGLVVCGTHTPHDVDNLIKKIRDAREQKIPFLGICFGHQLAAIEYARNVLGITDATSEEFGTGTVVIKKRVDGLYVGMHDGETYWNNYEVTPEIMDLWNPPDHFITTQYHPEYESQIDKPHPVLTKFIALCRKSQ